MKTPLELNKWYWILHLKQDDPKGYWGPAKYKGPGGGWEMFLLPEDLHREDEEETFLLFSKRDIHMEWPGEVPKSYFELIERIKELEMMVLKLTNE